MSNAIALKQDWTPEQIKLITDTVARGASPDELKLFLYRCKNMGLDPLKPGQIHFVKYSNGPGTIVVGIEGFRSIAGRTGKLTGIKRGVLKDQNGKLVGGWAEVYRSDWKECAREEVPISEYNTGRGPWAKMPETMIKKVAECAALRMAFPDDLGGVYEQAEMDQAQGGVYPEQPEPGNGSTEEIEYRVPFGKYKGRSVEQICRDNSVETILGYVDYLEDTAKKKGVALSAPIQEFIDNVTNYIAALENAPVEEG